jgi:hypothetical protein
MAKLTAEGYADSYRFALHSRMAQVYSDAIHDGLVARSPLSRAEDKGVEVAGANPPGSRVDARRSRRGLPVWLDHVRWAGPSDGPRQLQRAFRAARSGVQGLPEVSASTTYGTIKLRCSSLQGWM